MSAGTRQEPTTEPVYNPADEESADFLVYRVACSSSDPE